MIEVLAALLLVGIGVLGMTALQSKSIQYRTGLAERDKAAMLGGELLESMRATPKSLYGLGGRMSGQSDFFKPRGSAFPATPGSCTPWPDAVKDRLGCWAEQVKDALPGAAGLLDTEHYVCRSSEPGVCDGKGSMVEIHLAWRGQRNDCESDAGTALCHYSLRAEP